MPIETISDASWLAADRHVLPDRRGAAARLPAQGRRGHDQARRHPHGGRHVHRRHRRGSRSSTSTRRTSCSSSPTTSGSSSSSSNYTVGLDGISLPLFVLSSFITLRRDDLHVRQHAGRRQPQGVHHPDARAAGGHGRHVHRPGPDPVLRLLRDGPAADVLHDRRVGRRGPPVRLAEVLPLHDVRLGADAGRLPGAVLPDRRATASRSCTSTPRRWLTRSSPTCRSGSSPACSSASP